MSGLLRAAAAVGVLAVLALAVAVWAPLPAIPPATASPVPSSGGYTTTSLTCTSTTTGESHSATGTSAPPGVTVTTITCTTPPGTTPQPTWSCGESGALASADLSEAGWMLQAEALLTVCDGDSVVAVVEFHGLAAFDYETGAVKYELHARVTPVGLHAGSLEVRRHPIGFSVQTESGAWIVIAEPAGEWVPVGDGYDDVLSGVVEAPSAAGAPVEVAVWSEVNLSGVVVVAREEAPVAPATPIEPPAPGVHVEVVVNLTSKEGVALDLPVWLDSLSLNSRPGEYIAVARLALTGDGALHYEAVLVDDGLDAYEAAAKLLAGALDWLASTGVVAGIDAGDSSAIADLVVYALSEGANYIHIYWNGTVWDAAIAFMATPLPTPPGTPVTTTTTAPTYTYTYPTVTPGHQTIQPAATTEATAPNESSVLLVNGPSGPAEPSQPTTSGQQSTQQAGQEAASTEAGAGPTVQEQAGTTVVAVTIALAAAILAYLLTRRL